jgi:hypothetical protein
MSTMDIITIALAFELLAIVGVVAMFRNAGRSTVNEVKHRNGLFAGSPHIAPPPLPPVHKGDE